MPGASEYLSARDVSALAWGVQQVRALMSLSPLMRASVAAEADPGAAVAGDALRQWVGRPRHSRHYVY